MTEKENPAGLRAFAVALGADCSNDSEFFFPDGLPAPFENYRLEKIVLGGGERNSPQPRKVNFSDDDDNFLQINTTKGNLSLVTKETPPCPGIVANLEKYSDGKAAGIISYSLPQGKPPITILTVDITSGRQHVLVDGTGDGMRVRVNDINSFGGTNADALSVEAITELCGKAVAHFKNFVAALNPAQFPWANSPALGGALCELQRAMGGETPPIGKGMAPSLKNTRRGRTKD